MMMGYGYSYVCSLSRLGVASNQRDRKEYIFSVEAIRDLLRHLVA